MEVLASERVERVREPELFGVNGLIMYMSGVRKTKG